MAARCQFLFWLALIGCFSPGSTKDPLCEASLTIPTGECCDRKHATYCCSGIPVCSDGGNATVEAVNFKTDPCLTPWNSSACMEGFYTTSGVDILPCPAGYFCEANKVCIKPCPQGAYCIQNVLTANRSVCGGQFEKCCLPDAIAPIFNEHTKSLTCAGQFYPVRCLEGNYCPNTTTQLKCPAGYFCREGSHSPVKCPAISSCDEGEKSPNTLYTGLILNSCLLGAFFIVLLYFNNRRAFHFYLDLYFRRVRGNRKPSQRYNLKDGLKLVIKRLPRQSPDEDEGICALKDSYNIHFDKLSLTLTSGENKGKVLLQGVTGEINAGEVTAVLGPSGAGKTTFLNVLCGKAYYGDAGGTIRINGKKVYGIQDYKSLTGFVPQEDIMHRSLTVLEVLYYNAVLRLPPPPDPKVYEKIVKQTMSFLGIKHVAHIQIGDEETRGISGGQRRRVNIGMELVADPTILFLDEPTTGLDSASSLAVVKALNTVASSTNMTICCVIHQPRFEILKMFDKVLFLGQGGRTVYSGSVDAAEQYFASIGYPLPPYVNPADFYMDVIAGSVKNERNIYTNLFDEWEKHQMILEEVGADPVDKNGSVEVEAEVNEVKEDKESVEGVQIGSSNDFLPGTPSSQIRIHVKEADETSEEIEGNGVSRETPSPCPSTVESCEGEQVLKKPKVARLGFFAQLWVFIRREFVLQLRMSRTFLLDQALTMIAGAVLGLLFREVYIYDVHETTVFGNIIAGLGAIVAATRRFGQNRVVFWRESAAGINRVSYFLAVNIAYIPVLLISPAVYLSIYYSIAAFLAPFGLHYAVFLCAWYYLSGLGYVLSLLLTPRNSQMAAIVTAVIMSLLSGGSPELCKLDDTFIATAFYNLSFSRWVAEAIFEIEAKENSAVLSDIISRVQTDNHYDLNSYNICIVALLALGTGTRLIALLLLLFTKRGQQK